MRFHHLFALSTLAVLPAAHADTTGVDAVWTDNFNLSNPVADNNDAALQSGDLIQIGYFAGVDPNKDPSTYTQADWDSFTPLTGDGSPPPNPDWFPTAVDSGLPGYFSLNAQFNTEIHSGIPNSDVRIGLRFFDAPTLAGATHFNTVSASAATWIMKMPASGTSTPFNAQADMDTADLAGTLAWEGTPFKTDLVPGPIAPSIVLTSVDQTSPTTLEITWTGGDGSNDIQTSTTGQGFATVLNNQSSPATITINPTSVTTLLVRVIEP